MGTFWVDAAVGNDSTAITPATRVGDITKPYKTVTAALAAVAPGGGGDQIRLRGINASYAQIATSALVLPAANPITVTVHTEDGITPTVLGMQLAGANRGLVFSKFRSIVQNAVAGTFLTFDGIIGRSNSADSNQFGNWVMDGVNDCTWRNCDVAYTGPTDQLRGDIVAWNFRLGGEQSRITLEKNRADNLPGDIVNTPTGYCGAWQVLFNEWSRCLQFTYGPTSPKAGEVSHSDTFQMEGDSDGLAYVGNMHYEGVGRVMLMPKQDSAGNSAGTGSHRNAKFLENVWFNNSQFAARFFNCPDLWFIANTVWGAHSGSSAGLDLRFMQPMVGGVSSTQDPIHGTQRVKLKSNILRGVRQDSLIGTVTFTSDSGKNLIPNTDPGALTGYAPFAGSYPDIRATPTFRDPTSSAATRRKPDLRLTAASRGVNEGALLTDTVGMSGIPATDLDGASRVGTSVDIGAYEFGGTVDPGTPPTNPATSASGTNYERFTIRDNANTTTFVGAGQEPGGALVVRFMEASAALTYQVTSMRCTDPFAATPVWTELRVDTINLHSNEDERSAWFPQPFVILDNGDWLERVNQEDIASATPRTAICRRLTGAKSSASWTTLPGLDATFGSNPAEKVVQVSRIRKRSDGKLIAFGEQWPWAAGTRPASGTTRIKGARPFVAIANADGTGWTEALTKLPGPKVVSSSTTPGAGQISAGLGFTQPGDTTVDLWYPNEPDGFEKPNGDWEMEWRSGPFPYVDGDVDAAARSSQYNQVTLIKTSGADTYTFGQVKKAPFSTATAPVHPEVNKDTAIGVGLFVARTPEGAKYTLDNGATWAALSMAAPGGGVATFSPGYYCRSIFGGAGWTFVVSHKGVDQPYGGADTAIWFDRFQLVTNGTPTDPGGGGTGGQVTSGTAGPNAYTEVLVDTAASGQTITGPANAAGAPNGTYATAGINGTTITDTQPLRFRKPNLDIPADATVPGFRHVVTRKQNNVDGGNKDKTLRIWANGAFRGTNKASATVWQTTTGATASYGGPTDLWGAADSAELASWLRAADFEVRHVATNDQPVSSTAAWDAATAQAWWETEAPAPESPPVAVLRLTPNPALVGDTIAVDATGSSGTITSYELSLDGGTTFEVMPGPTDTLVINRAGIYGATLRVRGPGGSSVATVALAVSDPGLLVTAALAAPPSAQVGATVSWNAGASTGPITKFEFSLDGGLTYIDNGTSSVYQTSYSTTGTKTMFVRVTGASNSSTTSASMTVIAAAAPVARLTMSPAQPIVGQTIVFSGTTSSGTITQYEINLTGTWIDLGTSPIYTTSTLPAGTYTPSLRVTGPGGTSTATLPAFTIAAAPTTPAVVDHDVTLGPLEFPALADATTDQYGGTLDVVGAVLATGEPRPQQRTLKFAVRGLDTDPDPRTAGYRLRRQLAQLLDNPRWRNQPLFFNWDVDPEASAWLRIGGGELEETDAGVTFGDWQLTLTDCYVVGRAHTARPGRRLELADRRGGLVAHDTRNLLRDASRAGQALPARPLFLPGQVIDPIRAGGRAVAAVEPASRVRYRGVDVVPYTATTAANGDVVSYLAREGFTVTNAETPGSVRAWDITGSTVTVAETAQPAYTTARDEDPTIMGWERVLGRVDKPAPLLAMDNGVCRVLWLGYGQARGLAVELFDGAGTSPTRTFRRLFRIGSWGIAYPSLRAQILELTPERAVIEVRGGPISFRAILQRGWHGPRVEFYNDDPAVSGGKVSMDLVTDTGTVLLDSTPGLPEWVDTLTLGTAQTKVLMAHARSDDVDAISQHRVTSLSLGTEASVQNTRAMVLQFAPWQPAGMAIDATLSTNALEFAALTMVDARAVPVLVNA